LTTLADIDSQPASTLACSHLICKNCGFVDRDWERMKRGHICSVCCQPGDGGRLHFPVGVHILVDLIQQTYHSQSPTGPPDGPHGKDVGTVIYFCTLREALLNQFLIETLKARRVPVSLIERLLDDNKLANQRFGGMFTATTGKKWSEAVLAVSDKVGANFKSVSDFMRRAAKLRNRFLHEGSAWSMTRELSTECINAVPSMVELFVGMHNEYTHRSARGDA
jgi:hypothetical protein